MDKLAPQLSALGSQHQSVERTNIVGSGMGTGSGAGGAASGGGSGKGAAPDSRVSVLTRLSPAPAEPEAARTGTDHAPPERKVKPGFDRYTPPARAADRGGGPRGRRTSHDDRAHPYD